MTTKNETGVGSGESRRDAETSRPELAPHLPSFHPLALLFPPMDEQELAELAEDIRANGQREDIVVMPEPDGRILDGRHRYLACVKAGVEPQFRAFAGGDPTAYVISANLRRRHLTTGQRAKLAVALANLGEGRPSETAGNQAVSQAKAAEMLNVSRDSVQASKVVGVHGVPELNKAVERGVISLNVAKKIARMPRKKQQELVAAGADRMRAEARAAKGKGARAAAKKTGARASSFETKSSTGERIAGDVLTMLDCTRFAQPAAYDALAELSYEQQRQVASAALSSHASRVQDVIERLYPRKKSRGATPDQETAAPADAAAPAEPVTETHHIPVHVGETQAIPPAADAGPPAVSVPAPDDGLGAMCQAWTAALVLDRVRFLSGLGLTQHSAALLGERPFDPDGESIIYAEDVSLVSLERRGQQGRHHRPNQRLACFRAKVERLSKPRRLALERVADALTELSDQTYGAHGANLVAEYALAVARGAWEREQYSAVVKPKADPVLGASPAPATSGAPEEPKTTSVSPEQMQPPTHSVMEAWAGADRLEPSEDSTKGGATK